MIPTFQPVDGGAINIQDIKIDTKTATAWADNIQILDEGGATTAMYIYAPAEESGFAADGWLNEDFSDLADVTIKPGQSILVSTEGVTKITFAGQVGTEETVVTSVLGFNFVGNASPVAIGIQDIKIDSTTATAWADNLQILDEGGATTAMYIYAPAEESGFAANGWLNEDFSGLADVEIPAGLGFIVSTEADGVSITLPAAL